MTVREEISVVEIMGRAAVIGLVFMGMVHSFAGLV